MFAEISHDESVMNRFQLSRVIMPQNLLTSPIFFIAPIVSLSSDFEEPVKNSKYSHLVLILPYSIGN